MSRSQSFPAGSLLVLFAAASPGLLAQGMGGGPGSWQVPDYGGSGAQSGVQPGGAPQGGQRMPSYPGPAYGASPNLPQSSGYGPQGGAPGGSPGYGYTPGGSDPFAGGYGGPGPMAPGYGAPGPGIPAFETPGGAYQGPGYGGAPWGPMSGGAPGAGPGYGYGPGAVNPFGGYGGPAYGEPPWGARPGRGGDGGFNPMRTMPNPMRMFGGGQRDTE